MRNYDSEKKEEEERCMYLFHPLASAQMKMDIFWFCTPFLSRRDVGTCPDLLASEECTWHVMSLLLLRPVGLQTL